MTTCNPNILDNWYFIGGGSQQGGGQFPINQRGQATYSGNTYGIDRWNGEVGYSIVTVSADGVNVKTSSAGHNGGIVQNINNPASLLGKKITTSVLYDDTFYSSTLTVPSSFSNSTFGATAPYQLGMTSGGVIYIRLKDATTTGKTFKAVKIELGDTQTLCHNEGTTESPVWVLNEVPNYAEELAKCQRYLWVLPKYFSVRATNLTANLINFVFVSPTSMRSSQPTISNGFSVETITGTAQTGFTFASLDRGNGCIYIRATKNGHGLSDATLMATSEIEISAEL